MYRKCSWCPEMVYGCNGFTKIGELFEAMAGLRREEDVTVICYKCMERSPFHMSPGLGEI